MKNTHDHLCECGCGDPVEIRNGKPNRFIHGHHARIFRPTRKPYTPKPPFDEAGILKAQHLYESGMSTLDVAKELGVSSGWVQKVVKTRSRSQAQDNRFDRVGRKPQIPKTQRRISDQQVKIMYESGMNGPDISRILGFGTSTVYNSLTRSGVPIRPFCGENHPRWKGGLSSAWDDLRNDPEYKKWQIGTFERNDYTCHLCRVRGRSLHAHHIVPKADAPDRMTDPDNGITLCDECHNKIVNGHEESLIRLFNACLKVGRPVSERTYVRLARNTLNLEPQKCACGCGKWTRVVRRKVNKYIRGHAQIGRKRSEDARRRSAEAQRFKQDQIDQAQSLYDSGKSTIEVAEEMGVSKSWANKVIKTRSQSEAQQIRFERDGPPARPKKELPPEAVQSFLGGDSPFKVADQFGMSHMTVRRCLRDAGLYPRKAG